MMATMADVRELVMADTRMLVFECQQCDMRAHGVDTPTMWQAWYYHTAKHDDREGFDIWSYTQPSLDLDDEEQDQRDAAKRPQLYPIGAQWPPTVRFVTNTQDSKTLLS